MRETRNCGCILALLLSLRAVSLAQQVAITDYVLPAANNRPNQITLGPDGALWLTYLGGNTIGRMTIAGNSKNYPIPSNPGSLGAITAGPDGALWFCESSAGRIGRMTTAGAVTEFSTPTSNSNPVGITRGPDGALWFTESAADQIGRITTAGAITEYPVPTAGSGPFQIAAGPDGALWFTEGSANQIGRITLTGAVTEYPVPAQQVASSLQGITAGPDDAMWFTEYLPGVIGRIAMNGTVTTYPIGPSDPGYIEPVGIAGGPDGALWFAEQFSNSIGRITTAGVISGYGVPETYPPADQGPGPLWIAAGIDGALWFTEYMGVRIGQVVLPTASLSVSPATGDYGEVLTFTGSMFAPNAPVKIFTSGIGSPVLATATADSTGSFTVSATAPSSSYGSRLFLGLGPGRLEGAAGFSVTTELLLNPQSGPPGTTVSVQGFGFYPYLGFHIFWNGSRLPGGPITDGNGSFTGAAAYTFTVPSGASPGVYQIGCGGTLPATQVPFTVN